VRQSRPLILPAAPANFSTVFPVQENPISQGGIWMNGLADGLDWNNVRTTANGAVGASDTFYLSARYADDVAHIKSSYRAFTAAQWAQATVYKAGGYSGGGGSHELELLLRWDITAHNARGYECSIGINSVGDTYAFIVRWEGAAASYTALIDPYHGVGSWTNAPTPLADGDVMYAEISAGGVMKLKQNGITLFSYTDSTWSSGQPGLGFWPVDGATAISAGWKNFSAGNL
jgi:hypothetical protein